MKITKALLILLIALVLIHLPVRGQTNNELADYIKANYTKREVSIPMRDGVKLFTAIYEPKDKSKTYPILFSRTPYSLFPYGPDKFRTSLGPNDLFAKEGYIFVYQDVRGRMMSEGEFEDVRPDIENRTPKDIDESTDTYDSIEWMIRNVDNNNGSVGMYGISYPGFYTSAGAIDSHPALKAISPQAPVSDWFHGDDMHHNGALFLAQNYEFFGSFGQPRPAPTSTFGYLKEWTGRKTEDGYDYFLRLGGLKEAADSYRARVGRRIKFWDDMMAHPTYDQFWKDRNILPRLRNIKCAVMTVGGWYDNEDLYGALNTYKSIEQQNPGIFNILVVGPWFHGGWERSDGDWLGTAYFGSKTSLYYREKFEIPFFNHFLKGTGDISGLKEVNVFDTGSNEWKSLDSWQAKQNVAPTRLYLGAGGALSFDAAAGDMSSVGYDEYVSDPMKPVPFTQKITSSYPREFMTEDQRFASTRPDVLVYETEPLASDIEVAGDIQPSLFISSTGTDSDFIVKLIDVFPDDYNFPLTGKMLPNGEPERLRPPADSAGSVFEPGGYQMLLRAEPFPARFRNGFESEVPLEPGEVAKISYDMPGIVHTFKKGHRIMVQIQSTWFPLVARNPQKFMENYQMGTNADFQKATERIYRGGVNASQIVLPIVKRQS
jgi:uncharacterized protein